jgi:hypothetical protein
MFGSKTKNNKKLPAKDKGKSTLPTNLMSRSGQVISVSCLAAFLSFFL